MSQPADRCVLGVVRNVAEQVNLFVFNAAIEAAHAGVAWAEVRR
jgi:hypothetical protein